MSFRKVLSSPLFVNFFGALEKGRSARDIIINYIVTPINNGLIGFAIVFTVIISVRFFDRLFLERYPAYITMDDLLTASIGLLIFGLGRIILNLVYSIKIRVQADRNKV